MVKYEEWSEEKIFEACSFTHLIDKLYENTEKKFDFSTNVSNKDDFYNWQMNFRSEIINSLAISDMLENRSEITIIKGDNEYNSDEEDYTVEHFYIKSWMDTLIPVLLSIPKKISQGNGDHDKFPAFVIAHGHGGNKDLLHGRFPDDGIHSSYAKDIAKLGCITITMDQWGWYERGFGGKYNTEENKYGLNMLLFGRTINGLRFFDAIKQIDYLLSREDVDPERIGIVGLSLGGVTSAWVSAIDPRIKMSIIAGYTNTFKDSILDIPHCSCNYIPGMLILGEMYDLISMIAPNPLCIITGELDEIFPLNSAKYAYEKIKQAYRLFDAEDNCVLDITPLGHGWSGNIAYPFIKKHWNM